MGNTTSSPGDLPSGVITRAVLRFPLRPSRAKDGKLESVCGLSAGYTALEFHRSGERGFFKCPKAYTVQLEVRKNTAEAPLICDPGLLGCAHPRSVLLDLGDAFSHEGRCTSRANADAVFVHHLFRKTCHAVGSLLL